MWNWIAYLEREKIILIKIYDAGIVFDNFFLCSEVLWGKLPQNSLETPEKGRKFSKWQKHSQTFLSPRHKLLAKSKIYRFRFPVLLLFLSGQRSQPWNLLLPVAIESHKESIFIFLVHAWSCFVTFCCLFLLDVILMLWYHAGLSAVGFILKKKHEARWKMTL